MRICFLVVLFSYLLVGFSGVSSRIVLPPYGGYGSASSEQGSVQNPQPFQITQTPDEEELEKLGSSPPSCDHKCYGCMPCEAIQVPTTSSRVGVQYTNYEPEGWKCKCGPTLYSP